MITAELNSQKKGDLYKANDAPRKKLKEKEENI